MTARTMTARTMTVRSCGRGARRATPTAWTPKTRARCAWQGRRRDERPEQSIARERSLRVEAHALREHRPRLAGLETWSPAGAPGAPVPGLHHRHLHAHDDVVAAGNHRHRR